MNNFHEMIDTNAFIKTLFESLPCSIMIIDQHQRIQTVNNYLERSLNISSDSIINKSIGEAIRCINHVESSKPCGQGEFCHDCQIYRTAFNALEGDKIHRTRIKKRVLIGEEWKDIMLLVSSAPIEFDNQKMAMLILEDITELSKLRDSLRSQKGYAGLVSRNNEMLKLFDMIEDLSQVDVPVLIQGESGTGKELVASAIHYQGKRSARPFVAVNCGAIPENLIESELFGHVKGAFTGATKDKKGRFEIADGGTIFLDELNDLSPLMQVKLLRVLQEGTFERVGSETTTKVNVRIISATNKDIQKEISEGRFREDLYYRICVMPIFIPPLRDRRDDIPLLIDHFLRELSFELNHDNAIFSREAMDVMINYNWPGNIRQLQNAIKYALVKSRDQVIDAANLPDYLQSIIYNHKFKMMKRRRKRKLDETAVMNALKETNGNRLEAAKKLGVARATLYRYFEFMEDKNAGS